MDYIDFSLEDNRIIDLQESLRRLSLLTGTPSIPVAVDGSFDEGTRSAIAEFQQYAGLDPTGTVTPETVETLYHSLVRAESERGEPRMISPFRSGMKVGLGERSETVAIIRIILGEIALQHDLPILPIGDIFDAPTKEAVILFQTLGGLPPTGVVDLPTWNLMALHYSNRNLQ